VVVGTGRLTQENVVKAMEGVEAGRAIMNTLVVPPWLYLAACVIRDHMHECAGIVLGVDQTDFTSTQIPCPGGANIPWLLHARFEDGEQRLFVSSGCTPREESWK
jgi:hypothetical protein